MRTTGQGIPTRAGMPTLNPRASASGVQISTNMPVASTLYLTMANKDKIKRKTLLFKAMHNGKGYYTSKNVHCYFTDGGMGEAWVLSKTKPGASSSLVGHCLPDERNPNMPPLAGWQADRFEGEIILSAAKPADWKEGDIREVDERIAKLCAVLKKSESSDGGWKISIKDICRNISAVKEHLPELLKDFPKIDADADGCVTMEELHEYFSPDQVKEYSKERLDEIWNMLQSKRTNDKLSKDALFLEDLAGHIEFLDEKMPEMFDCFGEVDTSHNGRIEHEEFDAYFGSADMWLTAKLKNIIGLHELKEQVHTFYWQMRLDRLRRKGGHMVNNDEAIVIMCKGSPGTGKTSIGRLIAGLLHKIEIIPTDNFTECQRDELVGDHIGATEKATEAVIEKAKGGVLFVDEAYRLNSDIFGVEAINCLMKAMTIKGNVIILAGYPKQMDEFVTCNPGLKRRITYEMTFPDYTHEDLAKILHTQVAKRGFVINESVSLPQLTELIKSNTSKEQMSSFNGGVGEHITRHAIFHLNESQVPLVMGCKKGEEPTPSNVLRFEDLQAGCKHIPPPPPPVDLKPAMDSKVYTR